MHAPSLYFTRTTTLRHPSSNAGGETTFPPPFPPPSHTLPTPPVATLASLECPLPLHALGWHIGTIRSAVSCACLDTQGQTSAKSSRSAHFEVPEKWEKSRGDDCILSEGCARGTNREESTQIVHLGEKCGTASKVHVRRSIWGKILSVNRSGNLRRWESTYVGTIPRRDL